MVDTIYEIYEYVVKCETQTFSSASTKYLCL